MRGEGRGRQRWIPAWLKNDTELLQLFLSHSSHLSGVKWSFKPGSDGSRGDSCSSCPSPRPGAAGPAGEGMRSRAGRKDPLLQGMESCRKQGEGQRGQRGQRSAPAVAPVTLLQPPGSGDRGFDADVGLQKVHLQGLQQPSPALEIKIQLRWGLFSLSSSPQPLNLLHQLGF